MSDRARKKLIVGLGGTFREDSSSELLVRAVLAGCEAMGAATIMFDGPSLARLPHYNPGTPTRTAEERALVDAVRRCDGLVIGSPGYHGGYSGMVKNAIDLLEELREDDRSYFDGLPVGLVVSVAGWQACGTTLSALRDVVHAMRGWPTPVGIAMNSIVQKPFENGRLVDEQIAAAVSTQSEQIMSHRRAAV